MDEWDFDKDGEAVSVRIQGDRMSSDGFALRQMAIDGIGLVRKSLWDVSDDLKSGRLLSVLDDYTRSPFGFHLLTDHRTMMLCRILAVH